MFRSNGGCGYVKKPDFLMNTGPNNEVFDPKATLVVKKTLKVSKLNSPTFQIKFYFITRKNIRHYNFSGESIYG